MIITNKDYFLRREEVEKERSVIKNSISNQRMKIADLKEMLSVAEDELYKLLDRSDSFDVEYPEFLKKYRPMSEAPKDGTAIIVYDSRSCGEDESSIVRWRTNKHGETGWVDEEDDDYVRPDDVFVGFMLTSWK